MYPVSNAYLDTIFDDQRETRITGTLRLKNGTTVSIDNELVAEAPVISNQCVNDTELKLGQAYQAQLDIGLYLNIDRYKIYGATITLSHGVKLSDDPETWEDVPLGVFKVKECIRTSNDILKITALDEMDKLDKKYPGGIELSGEAYDILGVIAVNNGMTLSQTRAQIRALPNGTKVGFKLRDKYRSTTWRDLLGDMAACLAGNAILDREGKLFIQSFATDVTLTIPADARTRESISDYEVIYSSASCLRRQDLISVGNDSGQDLALDANDFIQKNTQEWAEDVLQEILDAISPLRYTPSDISWYGDPAIDLGDLIQATGSAAMNSTLIPVQKNKWKWRGEHQIVAVGKNPYLGETQSLTDKRLSKLSDEEDSTGKIEFASFVNPNAIIITRSNEVDIGQVRFAVSEEADVEVWVELKIHTTFNSDQKAGIQINYYLNGELLTEYHPVEEWEDIGVVPDFELRGTTLVYTERNRTSNNNAHTVNFHYHLPSVIAGTYVLKVTATGLNGAEIIDAGDAHILVWAQGMLGDDVWDGVIPARDEYELLDIGSIDPEELSDSVTVNTDVPRSLQISDAVQIKRFKGIPLKGRIQDFAMIIMERMLMNVVTENGIDGICDETGLNNIITEGSDEE